jgi:phage-related minor tail protein
MARGSDKTVGFGVNATDRTGKALKGVKRNLNEVNREAKGLAGRFRSVARATVIMEGPLGGTAGRLSAVATMLNSTNALSIAVGIGFAGLTAGVYKSITAYSDFERQSFKINQLLEQTNSASGLTGTQIEDMAQRIGKSTLESADGVREASAILLSFKSVAGSTFERTMQMAADMSAVTGQDLKSSIIQLGKAMEDPATGMTNLRRVGVSFTNSQKDMIVAMKDSGDAAGAQAEILTLLEAQMGGAGVASGKGLAGAADLVAHNWNNMLESFGRSGTGNVATEFLNNVAKGLDKVNDLLFPAEAIQFQKMFERRNEITAELQEQESKWIKPTGYIERLKAESAELEKQMLALQDKNVARLRAEREAELASKKEQERLAALNAEEAKYEAEKKARDEAQKKRDKDIAKAGKYGDKLASELAKFENSLLEKSHAEDIYLEQRLAKISENEANGLIKKQEAFEQEQMAYQLHNAKITEINRAEKEKSAEEEEKLAELKKKTNIQAFSDVATLMTTSNKKLFKIGKAAALAGAIVAGQKSAAESLANGGGYPWGVPAMLASLVKTGVNIATI